MSDVKYLVEFAEKTEVSVSIDNKLKHLNTESVAAVSIRAKVAARHIYTRASRVAYTNPTKRNRRHRRLIMLCCPRMSLEHATEKMASVSGPFIKWSSRKTIVLITS